MRNAVDMQPSQTMAPTYGRACIFLLSILFFQTLIPTEVLLTSAVLQIYKVHLENIKKHILINYLLNLQSPFPYLYIYLFIFYFVFSDSTLDFFQPPFNYLKSLHCFHNHSFADQLNSTLT